MDLTWSLSKPSGLPPTKCAVTWIAAKYKHVVLGLIFLKYISDAFQELYNSLLFSMTKAQKLTHLPTLTTWVTNTVQKSNDGQYYHRRLE